jgi:hypothetical protein
VLRLRIDMGVRVFFFSLFWFGFLRRFVVWCVCVCGLGEGGRGKGRGDTGEVRGDGDKG